MTVNVELGGDADRQDNGTILNEPPEAMRKRLAAMIALEEIDRTIVDVQMFGRGPSASVDLQLSSDQKLVIERFGDITKPPALTAHLASIGIARTFTGKDAALVGALISRLARHHESESEDSVVREWGSEFLRLAAIGEVDLEDQASRWAGFSALERLNPAHGGGEDRSGHALASASIVLVDGTTGVRLVRCGWFLSYVRREVGGMYSPAGLSVQMERVGWQRRGAEGWIKATCPADARRRLRWRFYTVPAGWEEQ